MCTVWHVDIYEITFKLFTEWSLTFATQMLSRRSGSEVFDTFTNINSPQNISTIKYLFMKNA